MSTNEQRAKHAARLDVSGSYSDQEICKKVGCTLSQLKRWRLSPTWEDYLEERCVEDEETLMLFPLSNDQVEAISRVTFTPDQDLEVVYTRLLMGLGTI